MSHPPGGLGPPGLPSPPQTLSPPISARSRPTQASSSGSSSRGNFGISNVRFRVGAPPLRPLPLENHDVGSIATIETYTGVNIVDESLRILQTHEVDTINVEFVHLRLPSET